MPIVSLPSPDAAAAWCIQARQKNHQIGYVPTMGALHEGHLSLINQANQENDVCCVSIFVNPLQFNNPDDLKKYPINFENDFNKLKEIGCDMVYTGTLAQFFPESDDLSVLKKSDAGPAAEGLEGEFRPGHLEGVATIVKRLLLTVGSCNAYFGEKDYQQTLVVKYIAENLRSASLDIKIRVCPTIREASGLALSSRNQLLTDSQKKAASKIYQSLIKAKNLWRAGIYDPAVLTKQIHETLTQSQSQSEIRPENKPKISVEYVAIRDQDNWSADTPIVPISQGRALIAAYIGDIRLIDNLYLGQQVTD